MIQTCQSPDTVTAVPDKVCGLDDAIAHVQPGDSIHVVTNHSRWTAAARHLIRTWWGREPGFELVMLSLSSLGALFFKGGLVRKVVTGYSGDVFPNFTPNPWFGNAYLDGSVEVEHWSFLAFGQRLRAAAAGLPAVTTSSIAGSSMADNPGFSLVDSPFGGEPIGLLEAYAPDVALLHAPLADRQGNIAFSGPMLEGIWGALAAKRGAIVTVEKVVDDLRPWSHLVRIPGHHVLAVVEAPMGAHPGGLFVRDLPVEPYGEDLEFWAYARNATRSDRFDEWIDRWILRPADQAAYLDQLGHDRATMLKTRAAPDSWQEDEAAHPPDLERPAGAWELAAAHAARYLKDRIESLDADAVLAGAGVANLAAWLAVDRARAGGSNAVLTAELGLWGYEPTPADPFVFNHRSFPSATMMGDSDLVLGTLVGGPSSTVIGCLGAAQIDRFGNINSTVIPGKTFLVGSGGGNDVASTAEEIVVVATMTNRRTVDEVPYITSPGRHVRALVTDLGLFERRPGRDNDDPLVLTAVAPGDGTVIDRIAAIEALCGWPLVVADEVAELPAIPAADIESLRRWDPQGFFLRPD